ncbi:glycosyltransferase family 2 protein [Limibaculum sp. FT325]|uniref:glycosyltransferase family 2 protein n=1 Tax=Thermohalobaculum sediminis TaxID=2939436 RepID=UPI0020BD52A9|nr:glycosyltransferase family A protein [Limibaculum sediminis]MCL5776863.1 glycosyltransferase family 2 protein [Limibaculum sediminis]
MTPAVSVLIPCFNAERWVGACIESALAQNYPKSEIIVFDDGSVDSSPAIIRSFGDRIRFEGGSNQGAAVARNRLLELSQGEWVQYLDADDELVPNKLKANLEMVQSKPDVDVLVGPVEVEYLRCGAVSGRAISPAHKFQGAVDPWRMLALWELPQTGGPLWRRSALLDVAGWRKEQPCCQEHELYLRLLVAGKKFAFTNFVGAVYRRFETGTLSTKDMPLVRRERLKIEARLEAHLEATGALTPERQWAINQARFELARSAWPENRAEARSIAATIRKDRSGFRPTGLSAPPGYQFFYHAFGFEIAERVAKIKRSIMSVKS